MWRNQFHSTFTFDFRHQLWVNDQKRIRDGLPPIPHVQTEESSFAEF